MSFFTLDYLAPPITFALVHKWFDKVRAIVPEPYLDEVFHARQAQAYWAGNWTTWDPKITTPPGLYVFTYLFNLLPNWLWPSEWKGDNLQIMRVFNVFMLSYLLLFQGWKLLYYQRRMGGWGFLAMENRAHAAINICLFPVLFFFSSLYYTDVISVCIVLEAVFWHDRQGGSDNLFSIKNFLLLFSGLLSLTIRQTNIFWVAIYLGGLQVVRHQSARGPGGQGLLHAFSVAWTQGRFRDAAVTEATIEDYLDIVVSLPVAVAGEALDLLPTMWPYLTLLASFAAFVLWNGGVVLGDKDNHIASIHVPQMLYIWPYIIFFSWPLVLPHILHFLRKPQLLFNRLPRLWLLAIFTIASFLAVHYNTIIHPFTLADNRHYTFYVFRILRLHPILFYLAIPVYLFCAWLAIIALGDLPQSAPPSPLPSPSSSKRAPQQNKSTSTLNSNPTQPLRISWLLIYLLSTTLSLITAPLVEPRYFIIPWVLWRLHVPSHSAPFFSPTTTQQQNLDTEKALLKNASRLEAFKAYDHRLILETMWFLLVNWVTGWVFLYCGFEWAQEPGKVQRFMW
ncbi:MAG: hypothetical protein Q9227_004793 [Pyrenula ochraceoflavens]